MPSGDRSPTDDRPLGEDAMTAFLRLRSLPPQFPTRALRPGRAGSYFRVGVFSPKGVPMSKNVGLWIDHESAFLVELSNGDETRKRMNSDVERHTRAHGGARRAAPGGVEVASENKADRRRTNQIKGWMREVITAVA